MTHATAASTRDDASLDALVAQVADEFRDRQKRGDTPDVEEYAARHPEAAPLLRKVLATFQLLDGSLPSSPDGNDADDLPLSGTLGDFRIVREVGRGGMGIVYEAEQISLGRRIALKVLPFASTLDPRQLQRFHNEARAAASLRHEHIVAVHAVGQERGVHFFAMQFIDGQTLAALIAQQRQPEGKQESGGRGQESGVGGPDADHGLTTAQSPAPGAPPKPAADTEPQAGRSTERSPRDAAHFRRVAEWGIQAAEALEHAHSLGIVHRDIKPGNLMIDPQGQLWVTDFGLARRAADSDLTMTGDLLGTLRYMSPEQALAKHDLVDHRSDVYSLGATLYEMLTLHPAVFGNDRQHILNQITQVDAKSPRHWDRKIPADLETIILKALSKEPDDRFASAKELANDLQRFLAHEPIRARKPTVRQKVAKWARRNRPVVIAAMISAIVITAVLGAMGGIWYQQEQARQTLEYEKLRSRQDQFAKDMARLIDDVDQPRSTIEAKLADPIKVSQLLSSIDGWHADLAKARAAFQQAENLASSNDEFLTADLSQRLMDLREQLRRCDTAWQLAKDLDDVRGESLRLVDGIWNPVSVKTKYEKIFQALGVDFDDNHPAKHAEVIMQTNMRYVLVAALDYWVLVTAEQPRMGTIMATACLADSDSWRDQVRTQSNWTKPDRLKDLVLKGDLARQSPQVIHLLVRILRNNKLDALPLLRASLLHHPHDF